MGERESVYGTELCEEPIESYQLSIDDAVRLSKDPRDSDSIHTHFLHEGDGTSERDQVECLAGVCVEGSRHYGPARG